MVVVRRPGWGSGLHLALKKLKLTVQAVVYVLRCRLAVNCGDQNNVACFALSWGRVEVGGEWTTAAWRVSNHVFYIVQEMYTFA